MFREKLKFMLGAKRVLSGTDVQANLSRTTRFRFFNDEGDVDCGWVNSAHIYLTKDILCRKIRHSPTT